jgi:hypothetical protein
MGPQATLRWIAGDLAPSDEARRFGSQIRPIQIIPQDRHATRVLRCFEMEHEGFWSDEGRLEAFAALYRRT